MHMPFDGYHYSLCTLECLPESEDLRYRRGAPETFDPQCLIRDLERIRHGSERFVPLPGFCHAEGDPKVGAHLFDRQKHNVVVCEGLYLLHDQDGWESLKDMFDLSVFVDAPIDVCMERLKFRNRMIPVSATNLSRVANFSLESFCSYGLTYPFFLLTTGLHARRNRHPSRCC